MAGTLQLLDQPTLQLCQPTIHLNLKQPAKQPCASIRHQPLHTAASATSSPPFGHRSPLPTLLLEESQAGNDGHARRYSVAMTMCKHDATIDNSTRSKDFGGRTYAISRAPRTPADCEWNTWSNQSKRNERQWRFANGTI